MFSSEFLKALLTLEKSVVRDQIARLTHDQRAMIRSSHACMERESTKNGLGLFVRLFSEYPQYKSIWPQFREIPDSALISSDKLRNHGVVYMAGLKQVVAELDDDDKLIEIAKRIAGSHCKWNICKFHIENMVPSLLEVLNLCMGSEMTSEIADSWTTLYDIIGNIISIEKTKDILVLSPF
ncbi:unnamed protein product [Angiostrongylus costaricensis]|uniref:GLOBIN domain-containing protein n=1 Tax=Angiostrongylus costaricensis TaxID=334426 RepID=A0A0R3PER1_ANGCS|nr:unnamed protein product [Angiostrongylus costaricensis]